MSKILDMFLYLIRPREPFALLTGARVFAAVYGAVIVLCGAIRISVFRLGMPIEGLPLSKALIATFC